MVEVTEMFWGTGFALDQKNKAFDFVKRVNKKKGWIGLVYKNKWCYRTYFTFKKEYESKDDYKKNFTVLNSDFVEGINSLGYTVENFNVSTVTVSVLEYKKPTTFREWRNNR